MSMFQAFLSTVSCSSDGVEYSEDGKTLISTPTKLIHFTIPATCEVISGGGTRITSSFYNCINNIKSIDCEKDCLLNSICQYTFFQSSLEKVDLTNCINLTILNNSVFRQCTRLQTVLFPEGLIKIQSGCFWRCSSLVSVKIPDSVEIIYGYHEVHRAAFAFCTSMETFTLTENSNLKILAPDNFIESKVSSIYIPRNATEFVSGIFGGKIASITIHPENPNYILTDQFLLNKDNSTLLYALYSTKEECVVPQYIKTISGSAFRYNAIKRVTFASSVDYFGLFSFDYCPELTSFEFPENKMTEIPERMLSYCFKLESVKITPNILKIGSEAFTNCTALKTINIDELSLNTIKWRAFFACTSLLSFVCPTTLSTIGDGAFAGCSNLEFNLNGNTHLNFDEGVLYIGEYSKAYFGKGGEVTIKKEYVGSLSFYQSKITKVKFITANVKICEDAFRESTIQEISLPASTTLLQSRAFMNCTSLERVTISQESQINEIPEMCFMCCYRLTGIEMPTSINYIRDFAFCNCISLENIDITRIDLFEIGKDSFSNTKLSSLTLPATVTLIDENCFAGSSIKSLTLSVHESYTDIIQRTFYNCNQLTEITFSDTITVINGLAFGRCTSLTKVEFPLHIREIRPRAFEDCYNLKEIVLKKDCDLDVISGQTFKGCKSLTNVTVAKDDTKFFGEEGVLMDFNKTLLKLFLPGSPLKIFVIPGSIETIGNYAFQDCVNLEVIVIPEGKVTSIGYHAFDGCRSLSTAWLPPTIETFGIESFINCPNLKCGSVVFKKGDISKAVAAGIPPIAFRTDCPTFKISNSHIKCSLMNFGIIFSFILLN